MVRAAPMTRPISEGVWDMMAPGLGSESARGVNCTRLTPFSDATPKNRPRQDALGAWWMLLDPMLALRQLARHLPTRRWMSRPDGFSRWRLFCSSSARRAQWHPTTPVLPHLPRNRSRTCPSRMEERMSQGAADLRCRTPTSPSHPSREARYPFLIPARSCEALPDCRSATGRGWSHGPSG